MPSLPVPGWEADMIKGEMNHSSVGTLVERTTLMIVLAKMADGSILNGFSEALSAIPPEPRKIFTYDQEHSISKYVKLTERNGMAVYLCDLHRPWQRSLNENINGLLCQPLLSGCRPADLHARTV